jgi:hypothetical protein
LPVPLEPTPIVIHESLLTAVQLQPDPAVTAMLPLAAIEDGRLEEEGEIVTEQDTPACVTVKVCPPIVIVPLRDEVPVLAATL